MTLFTMFGYHRIISRSLVFGASQALKRLQGETIKVGLIKKIVNITLNTVVLTI